MTVDTSTEAVTKLLDGVTPGPWRVDPLYATIVSGAKSIAEVFTSDADYRFIAASRDLVPALLDERDALKAEVDRLSTPPEDADVAALVADLGEPLVIVEGYSADYVDTEDVRERMGKAADALTRMSHALRAIAEGRE